MVSVDLELPGGFQILSGEDGSFIMNYTHVDGTKLSVQTTKMDQITLSYGEYNISSKIESFVIKDLIVDQASGYLKSEPLLADTNLTGALIVFNKTNDDPKIIGKLSIPQWGLKLSLKSQGS